MSAMSELKESGVDRVADDLEKLTRMVPKFAASCVRMKNPGEVLKKISAMVADGFKNLQVISDFDYTLSRFHKDGKRSLNCYHVVQQYPGLPQKAQLSLVELHKKYYPIDISHKLTVEQKIPFMLEWISEGCQVLLEAGLSRLMITDIVRSSHVEMRCGTSDMFAFLKEHSVPVLVISAGLGDVIQEILEVQDLVAPDVHLISNRFEFDEETGKMKGPKGDVVIHMYNKNETAAAHSSYFEDLTHRHNVVLLGDSTGDSNMADGVVNPNVVFRIGFLNDKIEERLPLFLDTFDVVLLDDQTMELPNQILQAIDEQQE